MAARTLARIFHDCHSKKGFGEFTDGEARGLAAGYPSLNASATIALLIFVVHMRDMAAFAAGDFPQQLPCRRGAVALKPRTKRKVSVAFVSKFSTSKDLAAAGGGKVVFAEINPENPVRVQWCRVRHVENQVEEPVLLPSHQPGFLRRCQRRRILSGDHRNKMSADRRNWNAPHALFSSAVG